MNSGFQHTDSVLQKKFSGCLLGGMIGDVIGAAVEAESPGYIRKTFRDLDQILALKSVPELLIGEWEVGRFTDDTQMTLCVAEWLASQSQLNGKNLLERFCQAYEPWRHYGLEIMKTISWLQKLLRRLRLNHQNKTAFDCPGVQP